MGSRWTGTQNEVCTMQNYNILQYSWCCSRSILACHHLWGLSKSQSSSFHSTSAEIQRFAAPSKTLEIKIPTEQPFDLTSQGLTVWLESMSLSGWVRDWRLGIRCSVPRPGGKVFTFFFNHGLVSWFFMVRIFGTWRRWPIGTEMQTSCQTSQMKVSSCLWILLGLYHLHSWRDWGATQNSRSRYQKTSNVRYHIFNESNESKNNHVELLNHSTTITSWKRSLAPWPISRSTEVATHWELLVLLEGSGHGLKMDENYDKSKKQNQSVL